MDDPSDSPRQRPDAAGQEPARYDRDLYSWAVEQAALLRAGRISEADALNIAEEIDDVGNELYFRLESALRVILVHIMKWDHQPERRSRSWWSSITVQRNQVRRLLEKNPGLKPRISHAIAAAFEDARAEAASQTRRNPGDFPVKCPYSFRDIMERPVDWPGD
jgi:hypothetical protein